MTAENSIIHYLLDDIADDFLLRTRNGETPSINEYKEKYPDIASEIEEFLGTLAAVAVAKPDSLPNSDTNGKDTSHEISTHSTQVTLLSETQIGPYQLGRELGQGGMGTVYLAEQTEPFKRQVALKLIRAGLDNSKVVGRFEAERQAVAMMDHSNIAKIYDAGTTETGLPFFVMELVDGIPVTKFCDENQLNIERRLKLFLSICEAIQHAHQKGIIHRDIKPANILVGIKDEIPFAKVIDFGLAKALDKNKQLSKETQLTELGNIVGTLQYMSPEQTSFNSNEVDTRTDIYSLGVLLYELLVGVTPLDQGHARDDSPLELLDRIQHQTPPKPSDRLSSFDKSESQITSDRKIQSTRLRQILQGDLDWIVMKSLEKEKDRRYETVAAFADDIQRFLDGDLVEARPPSATYKLKKFVGRNRGLVTALSVITALLFCGIIGTSYGFWQATKSAESERIAKEDAIAKGKLAAESAIAAKQSAAKEKQAAIAAKRSASEARVAEKRASESLRIFTNSIYAASPLRGAVADTRASELLRFAKVQIQESELDAVGREEFLQVLSLAFSHLAQPDAVSTVQELYNLQKSEYGVSDRKTLNTKIQLISQLTSVFEYEDALRSHKELMSEIPSEMSKEDELILDAKRAYARILVQQEAKKPIRGKGLQDAIKILEEVYEIAKKDKAISPILKAGIQKDLGMAYSMPRQPPAGKSQSDLGIPLLHEALKFTETEYGNESTEYFQLKDDLATAYLQSGKFFVAEKLYRETLTVLEEKFGKNHINTIPTLLNLSSALWWVGFADPKSRDESLALQDRSIARLIEELGEANDLTLAAMINSGTNYWSIKKNQKAIELFTKVVKAYTNRYGKDAQETQRWNEVLGKNFYESKQYEKAIPILKQVYQLKLANKQNDDFLEVVLRDSYLQSGKVDEHREMAFARLAKIRNEHGADSARMGQILTQLGHHTHMLKDYEHAEEMLLKAYKIRSKLLPGSWQVAGIRIFLGLNYKGQKKFDQAKIELAAGYKGIKNNLAKVHPLVKLERQTDPLNALIEIAKIEKNREDEEKWTKELQIVKAHPLR